MPLAERLRAAGTRTRTFLSGAIILQWLSTLCAAAFGATHVGWRFSVVRPDEGLEPREFWGVRRAAFSRTAPPMSMGSDDEDGVG